MGEEDSGRDGERGGRTDAGGKANSSENARNTMVDTPPLESPTDLERSIHAAMTALANDPQAVDHFAKLVPHASEYVQQEILPSASQPETTAADVRFRPHQFCEKCETDRSDDKGAQLERAFRFRLQTCMLRSLSFRSKGKIAAWINSLSDCIYACPRCYQGFCRAKSEVGPLFLHTFEQSNIDTFLNFTLQWEENFAKKTWQQSTADTPEADKLSLTGAQTYAMLELVGLLASKGRRTGLYEQLRDHRQQLPISSLPSLPSGLLSFAFDEDENVRSWAERQINASFSETKMRSSEAPASSVIGLLVSQAIKEGQWKALPFALSVAPQAFKGSALPHTLLANLTDDVSQTKSILLCMRSVLETGKNSVWRLEDYEYPLVVLSSILDSSNYARCISSSEVTSELFSWITPFVESLFVTSASDSTEMNPIRDSASLDGMLKAFGEGLKRVVHFLLERLQQSTIPSAARIAAIAECMELLLRRAQVYDEHMANDNDQRISTEKHIHNAAFTALHQVISLHSFSIANIAFRGKTPNAADSLSDKDGPRTKAMRFIDMIFNLDSHAMIASILALSEKASEHQRAYKRAVKEMQDASRKGDTRATQEEEISEIQDIFKRAAQDLDGPILVSSELWKNSYNLCRPNLHVKHFLDPLSKISAYIEPQFQSHITKVKDRHASTTSYAHYREKLKTAILSVSRRLRVMRGQLPMLLLDLSDVPSSQSLQWDDNSSSTSYNALQTLCMTSADAIMSLSLCAEPDIHKAAQNIIRTTFEDAETRTDCFRLLLRSSPGLAFEGVQNFLESFIEAASSLIEANDAAKWMVRSFSDVLDVLCSDTEGLLRSGTPYSILDQPDVITEVKIFLPSIWLLMCKSVAIIFKRTPSWSRVLPHDELTAWFRDVILFATEAVENVQLIQDASTARKRTELNDEARKERDQIRFNIMSDLSLPLEEASSWLRMNDEEIVRETREYFVKGLRCFQGEDEAALPAGVKERMLKFIDAQSKIEDDDQRNTLLSLRELADLRALLDSGTSPIGGTDKKTNERHAIAEDDDDEEPIVVSETLKNSTTLSRAVKEGTSNLTPFVPRTKAGEDASTFQERARMKQSRLSFQALDPATAPKPIFTSKVVPKPPQPRFAAAPARSVNRYQSASSRPAQPSSSSSAPRFPEKPSSRMAQLRQDFHANRMTFKPSDTARFGATNREMREPQAPEAKRTFASASSIGVGGVNQKGSLYPANASKPNQQSEDSSSDESDSSGTSEKVGLADLVSSKKLSPSKKRPKPKIPQRAAPRSAIMLEDHAAARAKREREEAERKRRLRETPSFSPLHRIILQWDFFAEGDALPHLVGKGPANASPRPICAKFSGAKEYISVLEPMLLLECWAEIQAAREGIARDANENAPSRVTISGRSNIDMFDSLGMTMRPTQRGSMQVMFQETDVVYLRETTDSDVDDVRRKRTVIAKVDAFRMHPEGARLTVRCCLADDRYGMSSVLVPGAGLEIGKLFSLTTMHRAYEALHALPYFDMLSSIIDARAAAPERMTDVEVQEVQKRYSVNEPQARAVLGSMKAQQGFHLIQGPPGTGKTKTICSLVAHFLQQRKSPAAPIQVGRTGQRAPVLGVAPIKRKILLCAPSNAAVDEVAKRVHAGIVLADGSVVKPVVVRIGREEAMNVAVKSISLEAMVEKRMSATSQSRASQSNSETLDPAQMHAEIRALKDQRDQKRAQAENARASGASSKVIDQLESEMRNITAKRMDLMGKLDVAKDQRQTASRRTEADRKRFQQEVLMHADIVCSTLGGAGHHVLSTLPIDFETVVIDEAAQAVELDTLIPLRYGCQKCILVGDPNQLPPTVISREAERLKYSQSLFVRLFNNPANRSNLLSIQYRMHPSISVFPSQAFYDGKLEDGPNMQRLTEKPWHRDDLLRPLRFFDCRNSAENGGRSGHSFVNRAEADMAVALYDRLRRAAERETRNVSASLDGKVGVVTMYKDQVRELKRAFRAVYGEGIEDAIDFNTVDGFQGQEKDVIILSCVRTNGIGFLSDFRRINVAITRAKSNLFLIANVSNLERNDRRGFWKQFIEIARSNRDLLSVSSDVFRRPYNPSGALPNSNKQAIPTGPQGRRAGDSHPQAIPTGPQGRRAGDSHPQAIPTGPRQRVGDSKEPERKPIPQNDNRPHPERPLPTSSRSSARDASSTSTTTKASPPNAKRKMDTHATAATTPAMAKKPRINAPAPGAKAAASAKPPRSGTSGPRPSPGIPIMMPGQMSNGAARGPSTANRPPQRPPQSAHMRPRPPPTAYDGPSERAKASLFMPKPTPRPPRR